MTQNEQIIHNFYSAFAQKDFKTMQNTYSDDAVFSDEVFINLNALQTRAMWQMLIERGKDLTLTFKNLKETVNNQVSAEWEAKYSFGAKKRLVHNKIHAKFTIENGKIVKHIDSFSFYNWASQALGITGKLLGWTTYVKNKVQSQSMLRLAYYMHQ